MQLDIYIYIYIFFFIFFSIIGFFKNKFIYLFIYCCVESLLLCTGLLQLRRVGATLCRGARASHCGGFSCCRAQALGARASVVVAHGLSSCGLQVLEHSSCVTQAQWLRGMWDLPGPGLEPMSPALAGGFLTTVPPGKPSIIGYYKILSIVPCAIQQVLVVYLFYIFYWVS